MSRMLGIAQEHFDKKEYAEALKYIGGNADGRHPGAAGAGDDGPMPAGSGPEGRGGAGAKDAILAWPRMSVLRRFFRFLGMVANEAKGLLVGLTSEGQARPEQEAGMNLAAPDRFNRISYAGDV